MANGLVSLVFSTVAATDWIWFNRHAVWLLQVAPGVMRQHRRCDAAFTPPHACWQRDHRRTWPGRAATVPPRRHDSVSPDIEITKHILAMIKLSLSVVMSVISDTASAVVHGGGTVYCRVLHGWQPGTTVLRYSVTMVPMIVNKEFRGPG
jgi:hypothetical protein